MRAIPLGSWVQFSWHIAALALLLACLAVGAVMARSLRRDAVTRRGAYRRWTVLGWSACLSAVLSVCVWPYLTAFSRIEVTPSGHWRVENYLGLVVAELPPRELRALCGEDLGGRQVGIGRLTIRRADGEQLRSVRISADTLTTSLKLLGYEEQHVVDLGGSRVVPPHRYAPSGPALAALLASAAP